MEFTIDRSTWRCGANSKNRHGYGPTVLLNTSNFMCCLGQISIQLGVEKSMMLNKARPRDLHIENILSYKDGFGVTTNSKLAIDAMNINDDKNISNAERENLLIERFKKDGHTIKFINNYMDEDNRKVNQDIKEPISPIVCCA